MHSQSVSLSNSVVTGCKPKVVSFLRVQISDRFRRTRTLCFVIPLSQHSLLLICKMCTKHNRPTRASIIFSSHLGLSSKRPPHLAIHPFRRFVKACMALATRCWKIWAQQSLRRSFRSSKLFRFWFFYLGGNVQVNSHMHAKVAPSNAIKGWQIIFSRSTKSEHAKTGGSKEVFTTIYLYLYL